MQYLHLFIDYGVLGLLMLMSVMAVAIAIERLLTYRATRAGDFSDRRALELYLTDKLHLIATVGSSAPYVGLLGTVLGIMLTFYDIGAAGFDTAKIMAGLAMALKATAFGLLVAIPAVVCYNLLLRRCKVILLKWDIHHG
jgi:biopolymer transport protein ExbB